MPFFQQLTGSWGDFSAPTIVRAEAFPGVRADVSYVPIAATQSYCDKWDIQTLKHAAMH